MPDPLSGQRVAVLGFARQGQALARWLPTVGAQVVVSDGKTADALGVVLDAYPGVEFVLGGHPETLLDGVDLLCLSGGVPLDLPIVRAAQARGIPLTNDAQLFIERCPAPVIGITGSAGKTTTTTLTGLMLEQAGFTTHVGGNIGAVLLDALPTIQPTDKVVMELSSFQLELMTTSPAIGAVLNITPNHLDRHGTMEAYIEAKAQIILHQRPDDLAVLGRDDANARALIARAPGRVAQFSAHAIVADGAFLAGERLIVSGTSAPKGEPTVVMERGDILLRGAHNVLNVLAACAIAGAAGTPPEAMRAVVGAFRGVEHRLELVATLDGARWYNDSIATAPERVLAALRSFTEPIVLLLGGRDKKLPWEEMLTDALQRCRRIIAFGEAGELILRTLNDLGAPSGLAVRVATLEEAVAEARRSARPGDVVLLSPGGTSYDAYRDFAERGDHFRRLVAALDARQPG
jgi:UDP-N-acetylmuramoylalanine--D-glutamate ligase